MYKIKFFGITVFKIRYKELNKQFYFLGIPFFIIHNEYSQIWTDFTKRKKFDVSDLDNRIKEKAKHFSVPKSDFFQDDKIAFVASAIYDMGGHTKWLRDMQKTLSVKYKEKLFILGKDETNGKLAIEDIKKVSEIEMFNVYSNVNKKKIIEIYKKIIDFEPKALFVFIHPDDIAGSLLIALIRLNTNIKIYYVNHATHKPNLGMSLANLILEEVESTAYITQNLRNLPQTHIVGLISKSIEENIHYSLNDIKSMKSKFGIPENSFCTLSGASSYKFFEEKDSPYLRMIKKLLDLNQNVYHVLITEMNKKQIDIFNNIFYNSSCRNRVILLPFQKNYELAFSCADLFIDSFPMSSALTFIDLMRLKVPYVVKINKYNTALSFHEYQEESFPYMYETEENMLEGINYLIRNPQAREKMIEKNYLYYIKKYEPKAAFSILEKVIQSKEDIKLYDKLNKNTNYLFK